MGYPVENVGDGAEWWWCEECLDADSSSSTNSLVVAYEMVYLSIGFDPVTEAAADDSELVQATHREWAVALARLILPRLEEVLAEEAAGSPSADPSAPSAAPQATDAARPGAPSEPGPRSGGGGPDRPFAASVPAPAEVSTDPVVLLQSAALAALLVFLMPFPSQLFNSTLELSLIHI